MAANFGTLNPTTTSTAADDYLVRQGGIDYKQSRAVLAAGVANARWDSAANYLAGTSVVSSDNMTYKARVASGPDYGGAVNPSTDTDWSHWKPIWVLNQVENRLKGIQNWNIPGSTGHPLPDATPRDYQGTAEFSKGCIVASASTLTNLTLVGGVLSADSGIYTVQVSGRALSSFAGVKLEDGRIVEASLDDIQATGVWKYAIPNGFTIQISFTRLIELGVPRGAHKVVGCSELLGVWPDVGNEEASAATLFNREYASIPIGSAFPLSTHIDGIDPPPTNDPRFRIIKLSSGDTYNNGILINEVVTGTAPILSVTAEINFPQSPIHGERVELRNTSSVFSRAGENSGIVLGDTIREITGAITPTVNQEGSAFIPTHNGEGALESSTTVTTTVLAYTGGSVTRTAGIKFKASNVVPTSNQNQPVHIEEPYFMRIF
ncbi:hypothetical protein NVP1161O_070 [Vibrio phage 1.161.O._10N.261.48.C5]|nr:hypothetical protein NVP1161O_070 [Vibrio phage 1.161.O._10N.261.48.C5]